MQLPMHKTVVPLLCIVTFLASLQSSAYVLGSSGGIDGNVDQGPVDEFEPWNSASRDVLGQSSDSTANHATGPPLRRHPVQSSSSSTDEDGDVCELKLSQQRQMYSTSTCTWNITYAVLKELKRDIQSVVSCAAPGDVVLLPTTERIQPRRSIIISKTLTIRAQPAGAASKEDPFADAERKVRISCPKKGDLIVIRNGSVLFSNLIFEDCNGTGNVMSIETSCDENSSHDTIQFLHSEFKNLIPTRKHRILEVAHPICLQLLLEDVIIRENRCGKKGCLALSMSNTLIDIRVAGNRAADVNSPEMSPVFVLPSDSQTAATNISASKNSIRLFHVDNSTLKLSESHFDGNAISAPNQDLIATGGSVLLAVNATVSVQDSKFANNSGFNGGAVYGSASELNLTNCTFWENKASNRGGACFVEVNSTLRVNRSTFEASHARTDGGGIHARNSTLIVQSSSFHKNTVDHDGSAMYVFGGNVSVRNVSVTENNSSDDGAMFLGFSSGVFINVTFQENTMNSSGGGLYMDGSNVTIRRSTFDSNHARHRGGAISARVGSRVQVFNTLIQNNSAEIQGGSIHGLHIISMNLSRTRIYNNTANYGGGIFASSVPQLKMTSIRLKNNSAIWGGACFFEANSTLRVVRSKFKANHAEADGGAIQAQKSELNLQNSSFHRNSVLGDGSALHVLYGSANVTNVGVTENLSRGDGAMYLLNTLAVLYNVSFRENAMNNSGGGVFIDNSNVTITHAIFNNNYVQGTGGAIYAREQSQVRMSDVAIQNNAAEIHGGGIYALDLAVMELSRTNFTSNNCVRSGGGIYISDNTNVFITNSSFSQCTSSDNGGGISLQEGSNLTISSSKFVENRANNGGGIYAMAKSRLNTTNVSICSNTAVKDGGGVGIRDSSYLLCRGCHFENNKAKRGGGISVWANESMPCVAQLQASTFASNTASHYGGGLFFMRPTATNFSSNASTMNATSIECNAFAMNCNVALLNTTFKDNVARVSGSAILTSDPCVISVSCNHMEPRYDFMDRSLLRSLKYVHPKNICGSWTGNRLATNSTERNVSTFGQDPFFSIEHDDNIWMKGDVASGFVLQNVTNGRLLPVIHMIILDAYGNGPSSTMPERLEASMESPNGFFNETRNLTIIDGTGIIVEIFNHMPNGSYNIMISSKLGGMHSANITVRVRECVVGEEITSHNFCQPCNAVSYNFNLTRDGECNPCPNGATCETRYIVPKNGYWHKGPCHAKVQECLIEEACTYGERQHELKDYSRNFNSCDLDQSMLKNYNKVLCRDGYRGPLCGSCDESYGLSVQFKCLECPHALGSVLTLIFFTLYLLAIASVTIRGGLPLKLKKSRANTLSGSALSQTLSIASSNDQVVNLEMVSMISHDHVASFDIRENKALGSSTTQPPIQSNEPELTRWITTEIFKVSVSTFVLLHVLLLKVMINFLQVTSVAASINVEWTEGILTMFEATEYVGALSSDALSRPIDCLVSSDCAFVRSIWRSSLNLFVPVVVVFIFVSMWGFITHREKRDMSYFWKRVILSVMAVTYIAYLGLTKLGVSVFYCVDVYDSDGYSSTSSIRYWAVDTSIRCYGKEHASLVFISLIVLLLVTLAFPLISAIYLFQNKAQPGQTDKWTHETMGFLYRAFKEKYVFWESLAMFRKACLSLTVVFSYPLGGQSQGLLALGVLLLCLYLQQTCFPYREEFHKLNYYESGSLLVSSFTFILGQFFSIEQCTHDAKILVEVLIITLNTSFFTFLIVVVFINGMNHIRAVLKFLDFPIDDNTSWWRLLKLFIKSKKSKATRSTN